MTTDEFLAIANNPNFIPGIYNYCDRWCERCHATARCSVFATEPKEEEDSDLTPDEKINKNFDRIHESFQMAMELIEKFAKEEGIDLDAIPLFPEVDKKHEKRNNKAKDSPLGILANEYCHLAGKWLDRSDEIFSRIGNNIIQAAELSLPGRNPERELIDLRDAMQTISWYHMQILVKLIRAMTSMEEEKDEEDEQDWPKDSDGSAKVALIGIDHSIGAWALFLEQLPEEDETIFQGLTILERLRRMTEQQFPEARTFYREGLDD